MYAVMVAFLIAVSSGFLISIMHCRPMVIIALELACLAVSLLGLWMFTAAEPSEVVHQVNLRQSVRALILLGLLPLILFSLSIQWPATFLEPASMIATVLGALLLLLSLLYSRGLAVRESGANFSLIFRVLVWGWGVFFVLILIEEIKEALVPPVAPWGDAYSCLAVLLFIPLIVISLITGVTFRQAIGKALVETRS